MRSTCFAVCFERSSSGTRRTICFPPRTTLSRRSWMSRLPPLVFNICDRCWSIFPSLRTDQHYSHVDEVCQAPGCGRHRFMKKANGNVVPRRRVWDFGIKSAVTDLLLLSKDILPTIVEARKVSLQDKGSFWSSPAGRMLDARCKFKFSNPGPDEIAILLSLGAPTCCRRVPLSAPVHLAAAVDS